MYWTLLNHRVSFVYCPRRKCGTSTAVPNIPRGRRPCGLLSSRDFQSWCKSPREPKISKPHCRRLAATSEELATSTEFHIAMANVGARLGLLVIDRITGCAVARTAGAGKFPRRRRRSGVLASGTMLLHELLCLDGRYTYPTTHACMNPHHFLFLGSVGPGAPGFE